MAIWDHTKVSLGRLEDKITWREGLPYFENRHVIHRDSPVDGGVYLGKFQREAVVVDSKKFPKLREMYNTALERLTPRKYDGDTGKKIFEEYDVLSTVFNLVQETMPLKENNLEELEKLLDERDVKDDKKIALDTFLNHGVGICRHHSLAIGALLELFKKEGYLDGKISVDRNTAYVKDVGSGGHGWCRYTNNETWILDVALGYFGRINDAPDENRLVYERPELM